jgi:hypothetical protein
MAVNKSPVVGELVGGELIADVAARWVVSTVSVEEQVPLTGDPDKHSTKITGAPIKTVPVRSIPAGFKMVWFERRVISKPTIASEFEMKTPIRICVGKLCKEGDGEGPVKTQGDGGQGFERDTRERSAKHTTPTGSVEALTRSVPVLRETVVARRSKDRIRNAVLFNVPGSSARR